MIEMEELEKLDCKDSTIIRDSKCVFNDYYIKQCYLDLNKNILKEVRKCKVDKQEMFKRDILFMAINCI
jgi:hypothetical protein